LLIEEHFLPPERSRAKMEQHRHDEHPEKMRQRHETVEHLFGTLRMRMVATQFPMKRLPMVANEMTLHVLSYI
jgi:hypothetical protein